MQIATNEVQFASAIYQEAGILFPTLVSGRSMQIADMVDALWRWRVVCVFSLRENMSDHEAIHDKRYTANKHYFRGTE